ncbi:hypothetical protein ABZ608_14110 [Streptomyces sp. NPDC013172]|uniref:hypothetical protein n=1 Tax=Streptomyces sp. NPDC013172 TaxID=3155009 RepID=UPI0033CA9F6F
MTPQVTVSGRRSGRLSVAGLIAMRPSSRTRLCHRLRTHPAGKGKRRSMGERDFMALIDGVHQLVKAPIVLVWDRLNTHLARTTGCIDFATAASTSFHQSSGRMVRTAAPAGGGGKWQPGNSLSAAGAW